MRQSIIGILTLLVVLILALPSYALSESWDTEPSIQWEKAPLGHGAQIRAMAYNGKDRYVAVGVDSVKTSADGIHWEKHPLGVNLQTKYTTEIYSVTYGKDAFIAVGSEGIILMSKDGMTWQLIDAKLGDVVQAGNNSLNSIMWDGKQFWAVGADGLVITSTDGEHWNVIPYEKITGHSSHNPWQLFEIKYLDNKYFIVGGNIWEVGVIIQSDNGEDWRVVDKNTENIYQSIAYNGKTYVASGGSGIVVHSNDGIKWTRTKEKLPVIWGFDVVWNGKIFFLNGEGMLVREDNSILYTYYSEDGITWKTLAQFKFQYPEAMSTTHAIALSGILYDGKQLLALNERNEVVVSTDLQHWSSTDREVQYQEAVHGNMIRYTGGKYFISSNSVNSTTLFSEDGENWTNIVKSLEEQTGYDSVIIRDVTWAGDQFFAYGVVWDEGWKDKSFTSPNGYTWSMNSLSITDMKPEEYTWLNINKIEFLGDRLVMFGNYHTVKDGEPDEMVGLVATTEDGLIWTRPTQSFLNSQFHGIVYGGGAYVITSSKSKNNGPYSTISSGSIFYTSTDLKRWSVVYSNESVAFQQIHWNGHQFIMSGFADYKSMFLISNDLKQWKEYSFPFPEVPYPNKLVWNGSYYLGVSNYGKLIYSEDGTTWRRLEFVNYTEDIMSIIWDGNKFITGGNNAVFYGTPKISIGDRAKALQKAGLLKGNANGFELNRAPNRSEAAVMLVRLLGKETEVLEKLYTNQFSDVPDWAAPYIGYLYQHRLTKGVNKDHYGSTQTVDVNTFSTLLLRALGYDDIKGDFIYKNASSFASEKGILSQDEYQLLLSQPFLREHMINMAFNTLFINLKDSSELLIDKLISEKAILLSSVVILEQQR